MAAVAAATSTLATAATATGTVALGSSFVDIDLAAADLAAVEGGNGFFAVFGIHHLDKTEATGASGFAIGHDADAVYLSVRLENLTELVF